MTVIRFATWNVNSIKMRLPQVLAWLQTNQPDALFLQELKGETLPVAEFAALGYKAEYVGQKAYNGVAILAKWPMQVEHRALPFDDTDAQARYIEVLLQHAHATIRCANLYAPNGNPLGTEKFSYKLNWLKRLELHVQALLPKRELFLLGGDYNIIPTAQDAKNPADWQNDALAQPESRAAWRRLLNLGTVDAYRALHPNETDCYTFWDYQAAAFNRNAGIRIDHFLLSPAAADRLQEAKIDREARAAPQPSDHTPLIIGLKI